MGLGEWTCLSQALTTRKIREPLGTLTPAGSDKHHILMDQTAVLRWAGVVVEGGLVKRVGRCQVLSRRSLFQAFRGTHSQSRLSTTHAYLCFILVKVT
jgi:hypothetical protein